MNFDSFNQINSMFESDVFNEVSIVETVPSTDVSQKIASTQYVSTSNENTNQPFSLSSRSFQSFCDPSNFTLNNSFQIYLPYSDMNINEFDNLFFSNYNSYCYKTPNIVSINVTIDTQLPIKNWVSVSCNRDKYFFADGGNKQFNVKGKLYINITYYNYNYLTLNDLPIQNSNPLDGLQYWVKIKVAPNVERIQSYVPAYLACYKEYVSTLKTNYTVLRSLENDVNGNPTLWSVLFATNETDPFSDMAISANGKVILIATQKKLYTYNIVDNYIISSIYFDATNFKNSIIKSVSMSVNGTYRSFVMGASSQYDVANYNYIYDFEYNSGMWTKNTSTGPQNWKLISMSSNGIYRLAAIDNGYMYRSSDFGVTWTQITANGKQNWSGLALSSGLTSLEGSLQVACVYNGQIIYSTDYGNIWTIKSGFTISFHPSGSYDAKISSSGKYILLYSGDFFKDLPVPVFYISTDYGNTFVQKSFTDEYVNRGNISGNGQYIVICSTDIPINGGIEIHKNYLYISNDYGNTFTPILSLGLLICLEINVSNDGRYIYVYHTDDNIKFNVYISQDYGNTWTKNMLNYNISTTNIHTISKIIASISQSGQYINISSVNSYLLESKNYGSNLSTKNTNLSPNDNIFNVKCNYTGQLQLCVSQNKVTNKLYNYIYISYNYGNTWNLKYIIPILYDTNENVIKVDMDSAGQYQLLLTGNKIIYASEDYGNNWSLKYTYYNVYGSIRDIAITADAQYIYIFLQDLINGTFSFLKCENFFKQTLSLTNATVTNNLVTNNLTLHNDTYSADLSCNTLTINNAINLNYYNYYTGNYNSNFNGKMVTLNVSKTGLSLAQNAKSAVYTQTFSTNPSYTYTFSQKPYVFFTVSNTSGASASKPNASVGLVDILQTNNVYDSFSYVIKNNSSATLNDISFSALAMTNTTLASQQQEINNGLELNNFVILNGNYVTEETTPGVFKVTFTDEGSFSFIKQNVNVEYLVVGGGGGGGGGAFGGEGRQFTNLNDLNKIGNCFVSGGGGGGGGGKVLNGQKIFVINTTYNVLIGSGGIGGIGGFTQPTSNRVLLNGLSNCGSASGTDGTATIVYKNYDINDIDIIADGGSGGKYGCSFKYFQDYNLVEYGQANNSFLYGGGNGGTSKNTPNSVSGNGGYMYINNQKLYDYPPLSGQNGGGGGGAGINPKSYSNTLLYSIATFYTYPQNYFNVKEYNYYYVLSNSTPILFYDGSNGAININNIYGYYGSGGGGGTTNHNGVSFGINDYDMDSEDKNYFIQAGKYYILTEMNVLFYNLQQIYPGGGNSTFLSVDDDDNNLKYYNFVPNNGNNNFVYFVYNDIYYVPMVSGGYGGKAGSLTLGGGLGGKYEATNNPSGFAGENALKNTGCGGGGGGGGGSISFVSSSYTYYGVTGGKGGDGGSGVFIMYIDTNV